jgi:hypothetical protein
VAFAGFDVDASDDAGLAAVDLGLAAGFDVDASDDAGLAAVDLGLAAGFDDAATGFDAALMTGFDAALMTGFDAALMTGFDAALMTGFDAVPPLWFCSAATMSFMFPMTIKLVMIWSGMFSINNVVALVMPADVTENRYAI